MRDAQGNVTSVYERTNEKKSGVYEASYKQAEISSYSVRCFQLMTQRNLPTQIMKLFYSNIIALAVCLFCHFVIILQNGRGNIIFYVLILFSFFTLFFLNSYNIMLLFDKQKNHKYIIINLILSAIYYYILFFAPLFPPR